MSTAPILFIGHISSNSLSAVKSPKSKIRSVPKVINVPSERGFSVTSTAGLAAFAQFVFSFPPPGKGLSITCPSDVVIVIVRNQHKINFLDTGILRSRGNTIRIPPVISRPPRINQQRLPLRRHKQRCLPAFHVHKIDLQSSVRLWSRSRHGK